MIYAKDIAPLRGLAPDGDTTDELKRTFHLLRGKRRPFFLEPAEFQDILHWKLGSQYGRVAHHRGRLPDAAIPIITRATFEVSAEQRSDTLKIRTAVLTALPMVGVPVASAVLALVMPEEYGVIDFRGWRQVFGTERRGFSVNDYSRYMAHLWRLSNELSWPPQEVDHAIWEYDRRANGA